MGPLSCQWTYAQMIVHLYWIKINEVMSSVYNTVYHVIVFNVQFKKSPACHAIIRTREISKHLLAGSIPMSYQRWRIKNSHTSYTNRSKGRIYSYRKNIIYSRPTRKRTRVYHLTEHDLYMPECLAILTKSITLINFPATREDSKPDHRRV